jgi:hydroxypyruvate isomerase
VPLEKLNMLAGFAKHPFAEDYPTHSTMTFFPKDMLSHVQTNLLHSVESSLVMACDGFDSEEVAQLVITKLNQPDVFVQLSIFHAPTEVIQGQLIEKLGSRTHNSVRFKHEIGGVPRTTIGIVDGTDTFVYRRGEDFTVTRHAQIAAHWRTELDLVHGTIE